MRKNRSACSASLQPLLYSSALVILPTHGDRSKDLIHKIPEGINIHIEENMSAKKRIQLYSSV